MTEEQAGKVLICVSTRGNDIALELMYWIMVMSKKYKLLKIGFFQDSLNVFANQANIQKAMLLESGKQFTHALMVDSDVVLPPDVLEKLYGCDKSVVIAPSWHGHGELHTNVHTQAEHIRENRLIESKSGIEEVCHVSFNAILIKREVFETFGKDPMFVEQGEYGLYPYTSDKVFSTKCKEKGIKMFVCYDVKGMGHYAKIQLNDALIKNVRNVKQYGVFHTVSEYSWKV